MHSIERLTEEQAQTVLPDLIALMQNVVSDGASIGFLYPLSAEVAEAYWRDVIREVGQQSRVLLVARSDGEVVGTAQLGLCSRPNSLHRAEVQKLFVHTRCRGQGIAKALMSAIEQEARAAGRSLLVLDTERGQIAEAMYECSGWIRVGEIPDFACSPDGHLHATVIFYRKI